jgi:hypothetical protein
MRKGLVSGASRLSRSFAPCAGIRRLDYVNRRKDRIGCGVQNGWRPPVELALWWVQRLRADDYWIKLPGRRSKTPARVRTPRQIQMGGGRRPVMKKTKARISPTTNKIQAILTAVPAMPEKPRTPAIIATIKKVTAQPIMVSLRHKSKSQAALHLSLSTGRAPLRLPRHWNPNRGQISPP